MTKIPHSWPYTNFQFPPIKMFGAENWRRKKKPLWTTRSAFNYSPSPHPPHSTNYIIEEKKIVRVTGLPCVTAIISTTTRRCNIFLWSEMFAALAILSSQSTYSWFAVETREKCTTKEVYCCCNRTIVVSTDKLK